jgi:hypothetical protein
LSSYYPIIPIAIIAVRLLIAYSRRSKRASAVPHAPPRPPEPAVPASPPTDFFDPKWKTVPVTVNTDRKAVRYDAITVTAEMVNRKPDGTHFIVLKFRNPAEVGAFVWSFNWPGQCRWQIRSRMLDAVCFSHFHNYELPRAVSGLGQQGDGVIFQDLPESDMIPFGDYLIWMEVDPAAAGQTLHYSINSFAGYKVRNYHDVFGAVPGLDIELEAA